MKFYSRLFMMAEKESRLFSVIYIFFFGYFTCSFREFRHSPRKEFGGNIRDYASPQGSRNGRKSCGDFCLIIGHVFIYKVCFLEVMGAAFLEVFKTKIRQPFAWDSFRTFNHTFILFIARE